MQQPVAREPFPRAVGQQGQLPTSKIKNGVEEGPRPQGCPKKDFFFCFNKRQFRIAKIVIGNSLGG